MYFGGCNDQCCYAYKCAAIRITGCFIGVLCVPDFRVHIVNRILAEGMLSQNLTGWVEFERHTEDGTSNSLHHLTRIF